MNNYFLGFFLDSISARNVSLVIQALNPIFKGQDIEVRWVKQENYNVILMALGNGLNPLTRLIIDNKIKKLIIPKFHVSFSGCELGHSRNYKDLLYLKVEEGGDTLRDLVFTLREKLKIEDKGNYLPHLTLGRISKDLTSEEIKNINTDIVNVSKEINFSDIRFLTKELLFIESSSDSYKVLRKVETS